jgi:hypothetical protein
MRGTFIICFMSPSLTNASHVAQNIQAEELKLKQLREARYREALQPAASTQCSASQKTPHYPVQARQTTASTSGLTPYRSRAAPLGYNPVTDFPPLDEPTLLRDVPPGHAIPFVSFYYDQEGLSFAEIKAYLAKHNVLVSKAAFHRFRARHLHELRHIMYPSFDVFMDSCRAILRQVMQDSQLQ